jgi:hypothetical protein
VKSKLKYILEMRCKTMALLAVYLFVTLSFIFFMSSTVLFSSKIKQSGKAKIENVHQHSVVEREAKAIVKEGKKSPVQQIAAVILYFQIRINEIFDIALTFHRNYSHYSAVHRYSYLSFLSLRI